MEIKRNKGIVWVTIVVLFGTGLYLYAHTRLTAYLAEHTVAPLQKNMNGLPKVLTIDEQFALNLADDKVLIGASHNVFVGRVVNQIDTKQVPMSPGFTAPVSQFSVDIIKNIKGNLQGAVVVDQAGGYKNGDFYVINGGDTLAQNDAGESYLLQAGATYLFVTRYQDGEYILWPYPSALTLISANNTLSINQLGALSENNYRVIQLKSAYPQEVLWSFDIKDNNTRNSYQSMHAQESSVAVVPSSTSTPPSTTATSTL